jgi:serine/threonine-protein kinase HipA
MRVGVMGHESSLTNALSEARAFSLSVAQARQIVAEITIQVAQWKTAFKHLNVCDADIIFLAQYLDGVVLNSQRQRGVE